MMVSMVMFFSSHAQQHIDPHQMNYLAPIQQNNLLYHDSVFSGVRQFRPLFERTNDPQLAFLLRKHQSNKIFAGILSFVGTITTAVGISNLSSNNASKGLAWGMIGGGFAMTLTGGYLSLMSRQNLVTAVVLFNQRYNHASLGIGLSGNSAGLVYKF